MKKLFKYLKPYKIQILLIVIFVFLQALSQLYLPTLMSDIIDQGITLDEEATLKEIMNKIPEDMKSKLPDLSEMDMSKMDPSKIDMNMLEKLDVELKYKGDIPYMLKIGGLMLLVALVGGISVVIAGYLSSRTAMGFSKILRTKVFTKVEGFSMNEFNKVGTSSLITRTTNDITQIQNVVFMMLRIMIFAPIMCIGGIIMAVSKDAKLTLVLLISVPIMGLIIYFIARKAIPLFKKMQVKLDKVNLVLRENLTGIRVIRAFNKEEYEKKRFGKANKDLTDTAIKVNRIIAALMPIIMLGMNLTIVAVVWFGGLRIDAGGMQVGDLMAFIQYIMQIMFALIMVTVMFVMIPRASASADRINEVLDMDPKIRDNENAIDKTSKRGYVELKDITFRYPGAEEPAVKNISFSACPGETTAIIGGTGSGKSTIVNLILRFYDVESGRVIVDGEDIRNLTQDSLRQRIGYVPQKTVLFSGTVAENIRYGKKDASELEINKAISIAQAEEFIKNLEKGLDSHISQGGTNISGGQKQRLSIARALVRKPEIYIFDDSFSALDFKTDAKLRAALKDEIKDSTVIIVAQRVSTVMNADRIIVLEEGRIAGMGRHDELMSSCDVYREIVASQLSEEELA